MRLIEKVLRENLLVIIIAVYCVAVILINILEVKDVNEAYAIAIVSTLGSLFFASRYLTRKIHNGDY